MADEEQPLMGMQKNLQERKYTRKPHRLKYSCEEIYERMDNGLCIFCDELDTPGHHNLKHKGIQIFMVESDAEEEAHQVHETLTTPSPIEENVNSNQMCDEKESASVDLEQVEGRAKTVAKEKLNLPLGQNIEQLVGKHSETVSTESSPDEYQKDSTLTKSSNKDDLWFSQKEDRVWEPGGLPSKFDHWDWPERELKTYGESHQVVVFLPSHMQVANCDLDEFKTFDRKMSNKTPYLKDKQEDEREQKEVTKLISSWNSWIWEPGGVLIELDKWKELESFLWIVYGKNLEADQKMQSRLVYDVKKDTEFGLSSIALNLHICCCIGEMIRWSNCLCGVVVKRKHWLVNYLLNLKNIELDRQREAVFDAENKKLRNIEADSEMTRSLDLSYGIALLEIKPQSLFASNEIYLPWNLHEGRKNNNECHFDDLTFFRNLYEAMIAENIWLYLKIELMIICGSLTRPPESNGIFRGLYVLQNKTESVQVVSELTTLVLVSFQSSKKNRLVGLFSETVRVVPLAFLLEGGVEEGSLVCSGKRWSFILVSIFWAIGQVVIFGRESFLALKNKREIENRIVDMTKVKQNSEASQDCSLLLLLKRVKAIFESMVYVIRNGQFSNSLLKCVSSTAQRILKDLYMLCVELVSSRCHNEGKIGELEALVVTMCKQRYVYGSLLRPPDTHYEAGFYNDFAQFSNDLQSQKMQARYDNHTKQMDMKEALMQAMYVANSLAGFCAYEVFHFQRPPELNNLHGSLDFIAKVLVQWKTILLISLGCFQ